MSHESSSGSGWDQFAGLASDLIYEWGKAKIGQETRPPAPGPAPMPYYPPRSNVYPMPALAAEGSDIGQQLADIFSSPRTWLLLAAAGGLVFVLVRLRR